MKTIRERLRIRMQKDRPTMPVTLNLPVDVVDDMDEIAPALGFSGHISLMRTYIGEGLRRDLERLEESPAAKLTDSLRKQGLTDTAISIVLSESGLPGTMHTH